MDSKLYDADFPAQHKVQDVDVVTLYHEMRFDELDAVIVCKSRDGKVDATFGQNVWNCRSFSRKKEHYRFVFNEFNDSPELQREMKLIAFGWLLNKNPKIRTALTFSSIISKASSIKLAYRFLAKQNYHSLAALSNFGVWSNFEKYLTDKSYKQTTIERMFSALNSVTEYTAWHKLDLSLATFKCSVEAKRLSSKGVQQTLVIPERLCDAIYGKAIALVEEAYPHRQLIADIEKYLQDNYVAGSLILKEKINAGATYSFINIDGSVSKRELSLSIKRNSPQKARHITASLANKIPDFSLKYGNDFSLYLGLLTTASFIICGGFSGMRDSELSMLTPESYYKEKFDGRDYHMLQSHTFKLGEKRATWVTAASSKLAIELMAKLTERWRKSVNYPDKKYENSLWVTQRCSSQAPTLITGWAKRFKKFCKYFDFTVNESDYQECLESNPKSLTLIKEYIKVGQPWPLSPHQFRRTLAFYCIQNRFGTLVALKQQFKHIYLQMTEWYTNGGKLASLRNLKVDESVCNVLHGINAETTASKIFKQWHSDETLSGTHGKAIMKMRGDVPTIYGSWEVIYKAVKEGKLTLHGSMHSYCKSGYDCDMDGVVTPQFCVDCGSGSSIIDKQQAKWWQKKHSSLLAYMASGDDISVTDHSHYITQIRAAEIVMSDFGMTFTPFEPELKVTTV
ncbi:hypothetical protein KAM348_43650 [Aeromonas caviae]|uniref:Integrase n=1 Tax=Aeromonas caviae TaxID=648 RepID=A0AAI9PC81_AERCA|nr:hypothetical protein [Aeromonas caviae]GJA56942.1 hypothetical protein KAM348_43650 [Aeromonas caviae]